MKQITFLVIILMMVSCGQHQQQSELATDRDEGPGLPYTPEDLILQQLGLFYPQLQARLTGNRESPALVSYDATMSGSAQKVRCTISYVIVDNQPRTDENSLSCEHSAFSSLPIVGSELQKREQWARTAPPFSQRQINNSVQYPPLVVDQQSVESAEGMYTSL